MPRKGKKLKADYIPGGDLSKPKPENPGRVRCLGPRAKEHYFRSPDKLRVRVCDDCRRRQVEINAGRAAHPVGFRGDMPRQRCARVSAVSAAA